MVKMAMSDENKVLLDCSSGAPPNIEGTLQFRYNNTCFVAAYRNAFDGVTFQIDAFADDGGTSLAVFFFLVDSAADGGQEAGGFEGV